MLHLMNNFILTAPKKYNKICIYIPHISFCFQQLLDSTANYYFKQFLHIFALTSTKKKQLNVLYRFNQKRNWSFNGAVIFI